MYQLDKKFKLRSLLDIFENVWSNRIFPFTEPYFPRIELVPRIFQNETLKSYRQCYSARDQGVELLLPSFCNNFRYCELLFNVYTHPHPHSPSPPPERERERECSVITRGTRMLYDTLYSTCTRENAVMMVASPLGILVREEDSGTRKRSVENPRQG